MALLGIRQQLWFGCPDSKKAKHANAFSRLIRSPIEVFTFIAKACHDRLSGAKYDSRRVSGE
jgi:hypothetical protein